MHQPQPLYTSLCCQRRALSKGAVPPLRGLRLLLRQGIGGIAEQQVCVLRRLFQRRAGGTVAGKDEPQPLARRAQHLGGLHHTLCQRDSLSPLQKPPLGHRYAQRPRLFGVEPTRPGQLQPVAQTAYPVLCCHRQQRCPGGPSIRKSIQRHRLPGTADQRLYRVGQRPGQSIHCPPDLQKPLRPQQRQRAGAPLRPKGLQKPGQTKDMVSVVVGQADGIRAHQVHPGAAGSGLGALAAVQQQAVPAALRHSGGQGALRQRHGGSRAQQCNGQHKQFLRGSSLLSYHKPRRCTILSAAA